MFINFDRTTILYLLIILFGTGVVIAHLYRYRLRKIMIAQHIPDEIIQEKPVVEYNPIITDLMADLFIGHLTGYVIGLIDGDEQELRFYRHLLDIVYVRFILGKGDDVVTVTTDTFISEIKLEISKIPSDNLQRCLNERLSKLVRGIESTVYYTRDNEMSVMDVHDAVSRCFNLIKHYNVIDIRRQ